MKVKFLTAAIMGTALIAFALPAQADNIADCEILTMEFIPDEKGQGGMQVATYGPANDFIASAYDDEDGHLDTVNDVPIRALLCQRNDVIPVEKDYALMATGVPFILSQDFDDTETDSLTIYWKNDHFDYVYKGYPLSDETKEKLENRLAKFTKRDHGLPVTEPEVAADEAESDDAVTEDDVETEGELDVEVEATSEDIDAPEALDVGVILDEALEAEAEK